MASTYNTHVTRDQSRDGQETIGEENKLILSLPRENGCETQYMYFFFMDFGVHRILSNL